MKYMIATVATLVVGYVFLVAQDASLAVAQEGSNRKADFGNKPAVQQPVELGKVAWGRNIAEAVAKSKKYNKPIALLFQEVPG